MLVHTVVVVLH